MPDESGVAKARDADVSITDNISHLRGHVSDLRGHTNDLRGHVNNPRASGRRRNQEYPL